MISVFTPTHQPQKLMRAFDSLRKQTNQDFQWVICLNNTDEDIPEQIVNELGLKLVYFRDTNKEKSGFIGHYKKKCCEFATGDIFLELDHDDALEPTCLEVVQKEMQDADFVYSDCFQYLEGVPVAPHGEYFGWKYTTLEDGRIITNAFQADPQSFGYIWFAPNHVRAWKASFYNSIGGHNENMDVCDDHELCIRSYIHGTVKHIKEPLYSYYSKKGENTSAGEKNEKIQEITKALHDLYIDKLVLKWCIINDKPALDLCCHENPKEGFIGVDAHPYPNVHVVMDLNGRWNFEDGSVGCFRMQDAIEHLKDPIHTMKELYRCLAPKGWVLIEVPSTDGRGAFQDPTHVSFWNANSFWYYCRSETAKYINSPVKFQLNRILDYFPSEWHKLHNIPYTRAHLVKLEEGITPAGGRDI